MYDEFSLVTFKSSLLLYLWDLYYLIGPLLGMLISEWGNIAKTGQYTSKDFKTASTYGYTSFVFPKQAIDLLTFYVDNVRPMLQQNNSKEESAFWLTTLGKPMKSGVSDYLKRFTRRHSGMDITCTILRASYEVYLFVSLSFFLSLLFYLNLNNFICVFSPS